MFVDFNIRQWAAVRNDQLLATLTWMPQGGRSETLYAATPPAQNEPKALTCLLIYARQMGGYHPRLTLEYPAGEMTEAIQSAGFKPLRTLLWMRADA
jgi:hypothetical protein